MGANKVDADPQIATKKFNFPATHKLPFFFVSAADGTNIVRVFNEAIKLAIKNKEEPADEVMAEIWNLLQDDEASGTNADFDDGLLKSPAHGCSMSALNGTSPPARR